MPHWISWAVDVIQEAIMLYENIIQPIKGVSVLWSINFVAPMMVRTELTGGVKLLMQPDPWLSGTPMTPLSLTGSTQSTWQPRPICLKSSSRRCGRVPTMKYSPHYTGVRTISWCSHLWALNLLPRKASPPRPTGAGTGLIPHPGMKLNTQQQFEKTC